MFVRFCCCILFLFYCVFGNQVKVDYENLDLKYYPYIVFYGAATDDEIASIIKAIDKGEEKTGLFLGANLGGMSVLSNQHNDEKYAFAYGVRLGYQSFLPSFFDRLSKAGVFGKRIYVQYISSMSNNGIFGRDKFSSILIGGDILLEFPVIKNVDLGIIVGTGVGSMTYNSRADSDFSFLLNMGIGASFLEHHRMDFEMKILTNSSIDWFGALFMIGYGYVF